jgi:activator of HSP90 ATPase
MFQCKLMEPISRRQIAVILTGLTAVSAPAQTANHGTAIHQELDFNASPARIYEALLNAKQFAACTRDTAEIQPRAGEPFKLFGGRIEGRNVELVPGQRIVQAWRPAYWPAGVYSIVKFELVAHGAGTHMLLDHAGFTEDKWAGLNEGWSSHYWEPLRKYLNA